MTEPYSLTWADEITQIGGRPYQVPGLYRQGDLVGISGTDGSGKTHLALHIVGLLAAGGEFLGERLEPTATIIFPCEDRPSTLRRVAALHDRFQVTSVAVGDVLDLTTTETAAEMIATVEHVRDVTGLDLVQIIVDPLANAIGDGDENSTVDVGRAVRTLDQFRNSTDATVILIAHEPHGGVPRIRGSSMWQAPLNRRLALRKLRSGARELQVVKDRDGSDEGRRYRYLIGDAGVIGFEECTKPTPPLDTINDRKHASASERVLNHVRRLPTGQPLTRSELRRALRTSGFFEGARPQSEPALLSRFIERLERAGRARKDTDGTITLMAASEPV